jgi:hypothetical protein
MYKIISYVTSFSFRTVPLTTRQKEINQPYQLLCRIIFEKKLIALKRLAIKRTYSVFLFDKFSFRFLRRFEWHQCFCFLKFPHK